MAEQKEDWEYLLGTVVYRNLLELTDNKGLSVPCKIRQNIEERVVSEFKSRLKIKGYTVTKAG